MEVYNTILRRIILPISECIFGIPLTKELKKLDDSTRLSETEIEALQQQKLSLLLKHAVAHSDYYKNLNINIDGNPIESLKKFPILTKPVLKENTESLLTQPKKNLLKNGSSGSTGEQTIIYWNKKEQTINRATQLLWWKWANYELGDKLIQTGINPKRLGLKKYKDFFFRTKYVQAFSHNEIDIKRMLKGINDDDYVLAGYASSVYVIAKIALENNIKIKFKSAISWGDKLFDHYKKTIQDAFGCKTYETYGSGEGFMIGAQKDLDYMYLMATNVFVEIVDDDGNEVEDGKIGNVIVTNLNGYAMPLIRYKIGDLAIKMAKNNYPANRALQLPVIQKIIGRDTDIVKTPSGNFLVVHSFTGIFEHIPEIKQFCVIQKNISGIEIQYIKDKGFNNAILESIKVQILKSLNEPFEIKFEEVEKIMPTKSGKPQLIVSHLTNLL